MRIAYCINQYPKVSHSFIRREILALECQGFEVLRIALRGWDGDLVDAADLRGRERTRYLLQGGLIALLPALLGMLLVAPRRLLQGLRLALRLGRHADHADLDTLRPALGEICRRDDLDGKGALTKRPLAQVKTALQAACRNSCP